MHVGLSLLTLLPAKVGGSEAYVLGVLEAFGAGAGPERTTVLVTDPVRRAYERVARGPVSLRDVPRFRYPEVTAGRALAIGGGLLLGERLAGYPANLRPHKNHARLIEALAASADGELCLLLTGGVYGRLGELSAAAERAGVAGRVRHLGYVAGELLPALYRRAVAMVFPSLYEGFGAPALEAMACGCPTAVAHASALPEACGSATLYFDPTSAESIAEAIDRLGAGGALLDRLGEAGVRHAAGFTWSASARRHTAVYRDAIAMGSPPDKR